MDGLKIYATLLALYPTILSQTIFAQDVRGSSYFDSTNGVSYRCLPE